MGLSPKKPRFDELVSVNARLNSWKEIAAYLERDPRTVQLWEKAQGFPVHRLNHNARASVYAYSAEIEDWLHARAGHGPQSAAGEPSPAPKPVRLQFSQIARIAALLTVAIAVAALAAAAIHAVRMSAPPHAEFAPLLAVLPFDDRTSANNSLADELTGSLVSDLGRGARVEVVARNSMPHFGGDQPLQQIASTPHAPMLLEGSVARLGNQMQLTVELVSEPAGQHLWGATYTRKGDPWLLPGEIASAAAGDIARRTSGASPSLVLPAPRIDPRAQRAYLAARFYLSQQDLADIEKAIALNQMALAAAPKYAPAYAGLAECYALMTDRDGLTRDEAFRRTKAAAQDAFALDPGSAEAYSALALATYRDDWDFARAEQYFRKAVALNPDSAVAHQWYGQFLGDLRRFDASIVELRKAKELDPFSPMISSDLADGYLQAGRLMEADAELRRVLELYPGFALAHLYRASVLLRQREFSAATTEAQTYARQTGDKGPTQVVAIRRLAATGKVAQARRALARLLAGPPQLSAFAASQLYFATGQPDLAYATLERSVSQHSCSLVTMMADPAFDDVRTQPRFLQLARRVGLPVDAAPVQVARVTPSGN